MTFGKLVDNDLKIVFFVLLKYNCYVTSEYLII